jgi:hypothetical protein
MKDDVDEVLREAAELGKATLHDAIAGEPTMYGSAAFFEAAADALVESTRSKRELGGACYFTRKSGAVVLVGLTRRSDGKATQVAVRPSWGSVLWHTHPGMSFSLAAFSTPDIEGARVADRAMLVIGYTTASPDVLGLTTATDLLRGSKDPLTERLLRMGVAAQVCWPNGAIRPVRRFGRTPLQGALEDARFRVDSAIGAGSRAVTQSALGGLQTKLAAKLSSAITSAKQRRKGSGER